MTLPGQQQQVLGPVKLSSSFWDRIIAYIELRHSGELRHDEVSDGGTEKLDDSDLDLE